MSEYKVLARKCRPQVFRDVVAQAIIVATLKNAVFRQRIAHAYLFCGSRGTGKTTLARLFAKAINCTSLSDEIEPCNLCSSCREITAGQSIDVLEIDGASHRGIEAIRQLIETIGFAPVGKRFKIYIIDEVHMLTKEAFNALLKTLEEPPAHVKFFFCTTEAHKIPATILSRCQRFNLRRIPSDKMAAKLSQIAVDNGVLVEPEALETLAEMAEGSLRDALSLLDQVLSFEKGKITQQIVAEVLGLPSEELLFSLAEEGSNHNFTAAFKIADNLFLSGTNLSFFLEELIAHFRKLLLIKHGALLSTRDQKKYERATNIYREEQLIRILELLTDGQQTIKSAASERTALEMLLLKILRTHQQVSLESLVERLIALEQSLSISEDPSPQPEELSQVSPRKPKETHKILTLPENATALPPQTKDSVLQGQSQSVQQRAFANSAAQPMVSIQEQSRFDTVLRFAAKELNGSLVKPKSDKY